MSENFDKFFKLLRSLLRSKFFEHWVSFYCFEPKACWISFHKQSTTVLNILHEVSITVLKKYTKRKRNVEAITYRRRCQFHDVWSTWARYNVTPYACWEKSMRYLSFIYRLFICWLKFAGEPEISKIFTD